MIVALMLPASRPYYKDKKMGDISAVTNQQFLAAVFQDIPDDEHLWITRFKGDPDDKAEPHASRNWAGKSCQIADVPPAANDNLYFCISTFRSVGSSLRRKGENFAGCYVIGLDDIGTKASLPGLVKPSYLIETSPGNSQAGILLTSPMRELEELKRFYSALAVLGMNDKGAGGAQTRVLRLPRGLNMKTKYGGNFQCRLLQFEPDRRIDFYELADALKIDLTGAVSVAVSKPQPQEGRIVQDAAIRDRILARPKIRKLWLGDSSGYGSGSDADSALLCAIAREATGPDQIERIYSMSKRIERKSSDGTLKWRDRPDYRAKSVANAIKFIGEHPQGDMDEAREFVELIISVVEKSGDTRRLFEQDFLDDMQVLKELALGDYDHYRKRIRKLASVGIWDDALRKSEGGERSGIIQEEAARNTIEIMGGLDGLIFSRSGFWHWTAGAGHWSRIELEEMIRQRIHEVVPPRSLTATLEGSIFRLVRTKAARCIDFDRPPHEFAINVQNGTLHWSGAQFELQGHRREDFLTGCLPVAFDPARTCPLFDKFLCDIFEGDPDAVEKRECVLAMLGYTLTPSTRLERFVILQGKTSSNGKSTLLNVIQALLGPQNFSSIEPNHLNEKFQKAALHGKLANLLGELPRSQVLPDDVVKAIVSGDAMTAENKGRDPFTFRPFATMWFGTNYMPFTKDFSRALFDRSIVLTMNRRFDRTDSGSAGTAPATRGLDKLLIQELPGILNRALASFAAVLRAGEGMPEPTSSQGAKRAWRRDIDSVATFAEDCLDIIEPGINDWSEAEAGTTAKSAGSWPMSSKVFAAYNSWADAAGVKAQLSQNWLTQRLVSLFPHVEPVQVAHFGRVIKGLAINPVKAFESVGACIEM